MRLGIPLIAIAALFALSPAHADELKLKDGSRIVGTIVGFEENSFKVKTSYGFAVVQKDQVASISMSADAKPAPPEKTESKSESRMDPRPPKEAPNPAETSNASPGSPVATASAVTPAATAMKQPPSPKPAAAFEMKPPAMLPTQSAVDAKPAKPPPTAAITSPETPRTSNKASTPGPVSAPVIKSEAGTSTSAEPRARPPAPPVPTAAVEPIRESVSGNTYTNETYGFEMYKPPTWEVIAGVPSLLPGAIAAMGTNDQTTYLLVGQEPAGKALSAARDATQHRLLDIMENFRPLGETAIRISGAPATEIRFRGAVDQQDWSGIAVFVAHGPRLFTIFGMTRADSDLVQIQENVISRAISSLQFTKP